MAKVFILNEALVVFREMSVEVKRTVEATLIPSGVKVALQQGSQVLVTQALGSSYTVYVNGNLVCIAGRDGDALGLVVLDSPDVNQQEGSIEDKVWHQLRTCYDPEIPVNIVDLGLVYECHVLPLGMQDFQIAIKMTLTAPGCGMGPVLVDEVKEKIFRINGAKEVNVELVFDPPWDRNKMSDEAKLQLGVL